MYGKSHQVHFRKPQKCQTCSRLLTHWTSAHSRRSVTWYYSNALLVSQNILVGSSFSKHDKAYRTGVQVGHNYHNNIRQGGFERWWVCYCSIYQMIEQPLKMSTFPTFHEYHHVSPHTNNNIHWVYRATSQVQCVHSVQKKGGNSYTMAKGNTIFTCLTHSFPKHYQIQLWGYTNPYLVHMRVSYCKHKNAYHSCVHELPHTVPSPEH